MLKRFIRFTVVSSLLATGAVSAAIVDLTATLDCAQANAGTGTCDAGGSGTGSAVMTLDDATLEFNWSVEWSGLSSDATVAHFHGAAAPDQNAGVQIGIDPTSPSVGSQNLNAQQADDLLNGLWYINIHSDRFPGGEIRGQVNVVPIPAAALLFGSGLTVLGFVRRKVTVS